MRKQLILSLSLLLILAAVVVSAATKASTTTTSSSTTAKYHRVHGDIASIDASAQSFTVKHGNDTSTFKTDSSTKFKHGTKTIAFTDLKAGDDVRVSFVENGSDKTAALVTVYNARNTPKTPS